MLPTEPDMKIAAQLQMKKKKQEPKDNNSILGSVLKDKVDLSLL